MPGRAAVNLSDGVLQRVVEAVLSAAPQLKAGDIMLVGALCRDVLHEGLGHTFATTATQDLDLALTLSSWDAYRKLAAAFPAVGDTGVRFLVADAPVDLLPFGGVEEPQGFAEPPTRRERSASGRSRKSSRSLTGWLSHQIWPSGSRPFRVMRLRNSAPGLTATGMERSRTRPTSRWCCSGTPSRPP